MLKEEWRMHTTLFGGNRFAAFPLVMFVMAAAIYAYVPLLGVDADAVQYAFHAILVFLGLNVGGIAFIGQSGMRNVLGDVSLLLYSSRTLPVSRNQILTTFLLKDIMFYLGLFTAPLILAAGLVGGAAMAWLAITYTLSFLFGLVTMFFSIVLYLHAPRAVVFPVMVTGAAVLTAGWDVLNPGYLLYITPSSREFYALTGFIALLGWLSISAFTVPDRQASSRIKAAYSTYRSRVSQLVAKDLLDVHRSSGGYGKIVLSYLVLFGVFWFMTEQFPAIATFRSSPLLSLAALLGMASLSTYNWLTRFDGPTEYAHLPLDGTDIIRGKVRAYLLIVVPLTTVTNLSAAIYFGAGILPAVLAIILSWAASLYVVAITIRLAGLRPNEMLLDAVTFMTFAVAAAVMFVPVFVLALMYARFPGPASIGIAAMIVVMSGAAGVLLRSLRR